MKVKYKSSMLRSNSIVSPPHVTGGWGEGGYYPPTVWLHVSGLSLCLDRARALTIYFVGLEIIYKPFPTNNE